MWRHIYRPSLGKPYTCDVTSIGPHIYLSWFEALSPNKCPTFFQYNLANWREFFQQWDPTIPGLFTSISGERCVREWTELQDGQHILITTPSVLLGFRLKVYRAEGTTQWYTAVTTGYNESNNVRISYSIKWSRTPDCEHRIGRLWKGINIQSWKRIGRFQTKLTQFLGKYDGCCWR